MPLDVVLLGVKDGHVGANSVCGRAVRGVRVRVAVADSLEEGVSFQRCFGGNNSARGGSCGVVAPCTGPELPGAGQGPSSGAAFDAAAHSSASSTEGAERSSSSRVCSTTCLPDLVVP